MFVLAVKMGGAYCAHYYRYGLVSWFLLRLSRWHFRIGIFDLMHGFVYLVLVGWIGLPILSRP